MKYNILNKLSDKHVDKLLQLYKNEWWTNTRTLQDVKVMLDNSQIIIGIENEQKELIAFARVLSDFVYKAFIFDIIVDSGYRGKNLGKVLMEAVLNHPKLKNIKSIELYCLAEMKPFYEKWGFSDMTGELVFMKKN